MLWIVLEELLRSWLMCTPPSWIVYRPTLLYKLEICLFSYSTSHLFTNSHLWQMHSLQASSWIWAGITRLYEPFTGSLIFLISSVESQCSSWTVFYVPVSWKNLVKLVVLPSLVKLPFTLGGSMSLWLKSSTGLGSNPAPHSSPCDLWPVTYFLCGSVPQIQERENNPTT